MKKIVIATRASNLALWQAYYIKDRIEKKFKDVSVELNKITSRGDKFLDKPLALVAITNFLIIYLYGKNVLYLLRILSHLPSI